MITIVDDLVSGASTTDEAFHLYSKSKACLKEGGFNLQRFVSNSPQLQEKIDLAKGVPVVRVAIMCPWKTSPTQELP